MDIRNRFGRMLRRQRRRANLSQTQLAHNIGCTKQAVITWEQGIHSPSLAAAVRLAIELDLSLDALKEPTEGF